MNRTNLKFAFNLVVGPFFSPVYSTSDEPSQPAGLYRGQFSDKYHYVRGYFLFKFVEIVFNIVGRRSVLRRIKVASGDSLQSFG